MFFGLVTLTTLLAACSATVDEPGSTPPPGVARFTPAWQLQQPGRGASALVNGLLLTDSLDPSAKTEVKTLAAVNVATHSLAWNVPTAPGRVDGGRSSFTRVGPNVVALLIDRSTLTYKGWLAIYSPQGTLLRSIPLPNTYVASIADAGPRIVGDQLLVADGAHLYAYDAASLNTDTPILRWQKLINNAQGSEQITGLDVDADGNLYIGTITNEVISYTSAGQQRWKVTTTSPDYGHAPFSLVLDNGRLFVESQDEGLQAYDLATGKTLWDKPADLLKACPGAPTSTASFLVAGGGKVYAGLFGGDCLPAYNESDGSLAWSFTLTYRQSFLSRPTYVNGVLYATNGRTYALDTATGKLLAQGTEDIPAAAGTYLPYDPVSGEVYVWGGQTLYAYKLLR